MPLAVISAEGRTRLAKVFENHLVDLSITRPELPRDVISFLNMGEAALALFRSVSEGADGSLTFDQVRFEAPVQNPQKFLAIGMNYGEHAKEAADLGFETPTYQLWFNKQVSCINGPFDDVVLPAASQELDFEAELAVVIGCKCRHVPASEAMAVVGGYMVANDVSTRDWQRRSSTMTLGKSFDTHGPVGPWLTLAHEVTDPHALRLRMLVNGEERQNDVTGNMIHKIHDQIAYLSTVMTLKPGDILSTGTPSGVGVAQKPPRFLGAGDVMRVEIDGLGHIENRVVREIA